MNAEIADEARAAMVEIALADMRVLGIVIYDGSEAQFCHFPAFEDEAPVIRADHLQDLIRQLTDEYNALLERGL